MVRDRLDEILALDALSADVSDLLQAEVELAAALLGLPIAVVSLILDQTQFFAAHAGLEGWMAEAGGIPVEWSFCQHTVADRAPFLVEDAVSHPRVKDSPLVLEEGIRCYVGVPLITSRGHAVGALCVVGTEPRAFTDGEVERLRGLGAEVIARLEARRKSRVA